MIKKIKISVDAEFGSDFQKEVLLEAFVTFLHAWQIAAHEHHKKNKIAYYIDMDNEVETKKTPSFNKASF